MCLALDRYRELTDKVDAFFARVSARHASDLNCAPGCAMCCHDRLTVTTVEADAIRAFVAAMPEDARAALRATAAASTDACAALDAGGRCQIYDARPLVCRSHGVPIRTRANSLPVIASPGSAGARSTASAVRSVITSCSLNFTARGPAAADPDCILDQETLSTILLALSPDGVRHDLAALLR